MASCAPLATVLAILFCSAYGTNVPTSVCSLSADPGPCKASIPSYFYNSNSQTCEVFIYGGCGGNGNRFSDFLSCMQSCHSCDIPGAVYSSCDRGSACLRTCDNPNQNLFCRAPCSYGCTCPSNLVLDEKNRRCVPAEQCPKVDPECPVRGQVYFDASKGQCAPCPATCSNPDLVCPQVCRSGCACPRGSLLNDITNRCVPLSSCPPQCVCQNQVYQLWQRWDCSENSQCKRCKCLLGGKIFKYTVSCPTFCKLDNGTKIPSGSSYQPNPCTHCTCLATGKFVCAVQGCARPPCDNAVVPEGKCCPVCPPQPESCTLSNGTIVPHGTIYKPDPCTGCTCTDGRPICYVQDCAAPPCQNYYRPPGQCCPVCPPQPESCTLSNGTVVPHGTFYKPDPCTGCTCTDGKPICYVQDCAAPPCQNYYRPPGQCCPVCPPHNTCRYNGQTYKVGDTFDSTDGCNTCTCSENGLVACTERACVRPKMMCPAPSPLLTMGVCTDVCSSDDDCALNEKCCPKNGCGRQCVMGTLCAAVLCAVPKCTFPTGAVVPAGPDECCPSCGCSIGGGTVVRVGESYANGCNRCQCTDRGSICTLIACSY